jgi:Fe-S cluster assembly iron-binding protein IscA
VKQDVDTLLMQVIANKPVIKALAHRLESFTTEIDKLLKINSEIQLKQSWSNLFELMTLQANQTLDTSAILTCDQFKKLTTFWQKRVQEYVKLTVKAPVASRFDKTLEIEILGQTESPKALSTQRLQVQVKLMQAQMLSGTEIDLSKLLVQWLMLGKLCEDELPLIERLQGVYCK